MIKLCVPDERDDLLNDQWIYTVRAFGLFDQFIRDTGEIGALPVVLVQPLDGPFVQGETSLAGFEHPAECCYLFGASNENMQPSRLDGLNVVARVYIPAAESWNFYSAQAASIVLWDRIMKRGSVA